MSYIDKITNKDTGESRVISPAAEAVRVSNENYEGENLDEVLDEVAHAIEDAGSGDGTVTGVKIGSTTYEPTDGVVDLSSPMGNKVDKNGTDSLMTAAEHTKLGNLPTADQLATQMNAKANDNAVVKTISVNGGQAQTPQNGNVDIEVEGAAGEDGITPHIGQNGNWWIGPETDPSNDTNVKAQGPMGSVTITEGDIDTLEVHNALNAYTGLLGMSGAMLIRSNIDSLYASLNRLYGKLANMAFWDAADQAAAQPTPPDWNVPDKTLAIANNIEHAVVTRNGEPVGSSINVSQGETVELIVAGTTGYNVTSVTASSGTATNLGNGTFKVVITVNDNTTLTLTGTTAVKTYSIGYTLTGCGAPSGVTNPTTIQHGGTATIQLEATAGVMPASLPSGAVTGANASYTIDTQDNTKATIILSNATEDVSVVAAARLEELVLKKLTDLASNRYYIQSGNSSMDKRATLLCNRALVSNPCTWNANGATSEDAAAEAVYSTIPIPSGATKVSMQCNASYYYGLTLVNSSGAAQNTVAWTIGSTKNELNFADYPNATHICVNFKIGSAGTTDFSSETYESMKIDFKIS